MKERDVQATIFLGRLINEMLFSQTSPIGAYPRNRQRARTAALLLSGKDEYIEFPSDTMEQESGAKFKILNGAKQQGKDFCIEDIGYPYRIK